MVRAFLKGPAPLDCSDQSFSGAPLPASPLALPLLLAALAIRGEATCPTASAVQARLTALLGPEWVDASHQGIVSSRAGRLRLELLDAAGEVVGTRELSSTNDCRALATAAAIIFAGWLSELTLAAPTEASAAVSPSPEEHPERSSAPLTKIARVPLAPVSPGPLRSWVGAGLLVSLAPMSPAVGAELFAQLHGRATGLGAGAQLAFLGSRQSHLTTGSLSWDRYALAAGPSYRRAFSELEAVVDLTGLASLLTYRGLEDLAFSGSLFEPGIQLRGSLLARGGLWLSLGAAQWFPSAQVLVGVDNARAKVPNFELLVSAGLAVGSD